MRQPDHGDDISVTLRECIYDREMELKFQKQSKHLLHFSLFLYVQLGQDRARFMAMLSSSPVPTSAKGSPRDSDSKISERPAPALLIQHQHHHDIQLPHRATLLAAKSHHVLHKVSAHGCCPSTIPGRSPPILRRAVSVLPRAYALDSHHSRGRGRASRKGRGPIQLPRGHHPHGPQLHQGRRRPGREKGRRVPRVAVVVPRRHQEDGRGRRRRCW